MAVAARQGQRVWPRACRSDICTDNTLWKKTAMMVKHAAEPGRAAEDVLLPLKWPCVCRPADMRNYGQARPLCGETRGTEETQTSTLPQLPAPTELASLEDHNAHLPSSLRLCQGNCSGLRCPGLRTTIMVSSSSVKDAELYKSCSVPQDSPIIVSGSFLNDFWDQKWRQLEEGRCSFSCPAPVLL